MAPPVDVAELIEDYTPRLVLYPEIQPNSEREVDSKYPDESPLLYDYHPRDIRLVLESCLLEEDNAPQNGLTTWKEMLDKMERGNYQGKLDLLPGVRPNEKSKFWNAYAGIDKDRPDFERVCYARVVHGEGRNRDRMVAQYWYAYFYNDFWNTHEMDFEVVMIIFKVSDNDIQPTVCAYSAHMGGHWLPWSEVEKEDATTHPMVYVANGSHANYFYGARKFSTARPAFRMAAKLLKPNRRLLDYTISKEGGESHLVKAHVIPEPGQDGLWADDWRWLNHEHRWGSVGRFFDFQFADAAPNGPPKTGDKWHDPLLWIDESCAKAPESDDKFPPSRKEP